MKKLYLFFSALWLTIFLHAQSIEKKHTHVLWTDNDTFSVRFSNYPGAPDRFQVSRKDTTDMGTDGAPGMYAMIYYGKDSMRVMYRNTPYFQVHYIPISSPKGKTIYRLHFNPFSADFPPEYIKANKGKVQFEIPEVYELANILWILSPSGRKASDLKQTGGYYETVLNHFKPWMDHPVFKKLDFPDSVYFSKYFDFRENSLAWSFKNNEMVYHGPYYYVMGNDWDEFNSIFKAQLPLIRDFVEKSNYRAFFKSKQGFYFRQIKRQQELMPVKKMWTWLEDQFPARYNAYKIIFSPLITGSHSTQNFSTFQYPDLFRETVMFVCGPDRFDSDKSLTEKQKEGLLSGVVFTEIDHNYVNPISAKYRAQIDSIFSKPQFWVAAGSTSNWYSSAESVFNEYMTHALFCIYASENYDRETASFIIQKREALMVDGRHFIRFREFNKALMDLHEKNKNVKISDLYPELLLWCSRQG